MNHTQPPVCARCRGLTDPDDPRHGTTNGYYNYACRCDACRAAGTAYQAAYRAAKVAG